ncbi:MAG: cupin domain-containing protein [Alphaproteobacteria bacterium HGW-Alphaproteobacteria-1]|jgi:quercetin dioxygenase-like cupin family protein|nr:MAG: cupin domain-containing protein [Alphaproteobacteria bacterium HGW-Alphaproteobacteria-1]
MEIIRTESVASRLAEPAYFTGRVWQEVVSAPPAPARVRALRVTFEPGARTAWHTHPLGQTLHVVSGVGLIGTRGGPVEVIRAGDTVWIPPGEEHWHGAAPDRMMCHLAIQEAEDGRTADWLAHVTDAEYGAA